MAVDVEKFYNLGNGKNSSKFKTTRYIITAEYFNETDNIKFACTAHFQKISFSDNNIKRIYTSFRKRSTTEKNTVYLLNQ